MAQLIKQVLGAPRRLGQRIRIGALERRLRQDPTDLPSRAAALAHYSREAEAILKAEGSAQEALEEPLGRARDHFEYVLQATSDIHRLHDVLNRGLGARLFYQLPELTARCMRKIGLDRECLEEFDTRSEFEERATQYHLANALMVLKAANRWDAARELFDEAVGLQWRSCRPIRWRLLEQTPGVYIEGLRHVPVWEGPERPALAHLLEERWREIAEELLALRGRSRKPSGGQVPAYPNLVEEAGGDGVWDMLQLYSSRRWHEDACGRLPRTAELLRAFLPSADVPYIHYNTEEVVLFLLAPGSRVRLHNGGSNAPLNIHLGLSGCEGAHLEVGGHARPLQDGSAVVFDDGTDHRVWHDGPAERWVLTVRVMHPQLAQEPAAFFSRAFTRRTCFEAWDEARAARLGAPAAG